MQVLKQYCSVYQLIEVFLYVCDISFIKGMYCRYDSLSLNKNNQDLFCLTETVGWPVAAVSVCYSSQLFYDEANYKQMELQEISLLIK